MKGMAGQQVPFFTSRYWVTLLDKNLKSEIKKLIISWKSSSQADQLPCFECVLYFFTLNFSFLN
jgi:hypothetical protein